MSRTALLQSVKYCATLEVLMYLLKKGNPFMSSFVSLHSFLKTCFGRAPSPSQGKNSGNTG